MIHPLIGSGLVFLLALLAFLAWRDMRRAVPLNPDESEPEPRWLSLFAQAGLLCVLALCLFILTFGYPSR
ncbi:MAG: hypothetical protein V4662_17820 [Verrucomicrobiota bacterium]